MRETKFLVKLCRHIYEINKLKMFSIISVDRNQLLMIVFGIVIILFCNLPLNAQISVSLTRELSFGTFYTGSTGGTVEQFGIRASSGSVFLINTDEGQSAIFNVTNNASGAASGSYIGFIAPSVDLTSASGGTMNLVLDAVYPSNPFYVEFNNSLEVHLAGTLTVGSPATTPGGIYSGIVEVIFNYE